MTNNIKKAVGILNRLREKWNESITEDEYFNLLDFIIEEKKESITYIPFQTYPSLPAQPDVFWRTTSSQEIK